MQREKIVMIQLIGWICLLQLLAPVLSNTTLNDGSYSSHDVTSTVGQPENAKKPTTESTLNFATDESTKIISDSSTEIDLESEHIQKEKHESTGIATESEQNSNDPTIEIITESEYTQKSDDLVFKRTTGSGYTQKSDNPSSEINTGSGFTQKSSDTPFVMNIASGYTLKSEDLPFGINMGSGYTQKSEDPSFVMNTGTGYSQKSEDPYFGLITLSGYTHNFEEPYFSMITGYTQKSEDPSYDIITKSENAQNLRDSSGIHTESGYTQRLEDHPVGKDKETEYTETSEGTSVGINTETKSIQNSEDSFSSMNIETENMNKLEDQPTEDTVIMSTMPTAESTPEPVYLGEMTITYQTTTENLKDSTTNENQLDTSTLPYSTKILYFDDKTTTEKKIDNLSADKSSTVTVADIADQSASTETLFNEMSSTQTLSETVTPMSLSATTSSNKRFTAGEINRHRNPAYPGKINRFSVKTAASQNSFPHKSMVEILSTKGGSHIRNSRTAFENLQASSNDSQTQNFIFVPTSTELPQTETSKYDESSITNKKIQENVGNPEIMENVSDVKTEDTQTPKTHESLENVGTTYITEGILDSSSENATEINNNATRNPKKIQENEEYEERYPEGRVRPIHPDPGYANYPEKDLVRPYRPDVPLHKYPYYRPTPDYRTPIIKEDKDYTRPSRPESEYPRVSFRPSYLYSKTSQDDLSPMPVSVFATSPKPYKPSFNRPAYHPQTSFGRPYRPDFHRPSSKPTDDYSVTKISEIKGGSTQEADISEHSRADYDYTKLSEMLSTYTKIYNPDTRPSGTSSDLTKTYGSNYDAEISLHSKATSPDDLMSAIREMAKVSKPDMNTNRPSSFYPRPGFGNNYQASDTSVKPFSVGTVTSAKNITRVEYIKADCFDNHMKVTMRFNGTFNGLVYSSGYASDSSCSYVNGSGRNHYEFYIRLNRCGTLGQQEVAEQRMRSLSRRRQERAQYLVNTVTVQYNPVIEEEIDEHFRVTCEYGYDFWKTVTFPVMSVESSAVKVRTGSPVVFTLPPPQCNMEIRNGFGPSGTRVSGPVNVGDPLTLVIHMKSESAGFDILVKNCYAHNGAQKRLQLIDSNGCVVQEKLVSAFRGVHSPDRSQQITLYSYLKAFRFTGSPALYIECDVHMCHGSCPPQRCYWRHMYKRSANEVTTTETSTTTENVVSESVSLFQALEVRHEEVDSPYLLSVKSSNGYDLDDVVCIKTAGFGAILACLLLLLMTTSFAAVCMCLRMRKMKKLVEAPDARRFVEFDGHVPMK